MPEPIMVANFGGTIKSRLKVEVGAYNFMFFSKKPENTIFLKVWAGSGAGRDAELSSNHLSGRADPSLPSY